MLPAMVKLFALAATLSAQALFAGPIGFTSLASAAVEVVTSGGGGLGPYVTDPNSAQTGGLMMVAQALYLEGVATANATATQSSFTLSANVGVGAAGDSVPMLPAIVASAIASASFSDTMTIYGPPGTVTLVWTISDQTTDWWGFPTTIAYDLPTQAVIGVPFDISASGLVNITVAGLESGTDLLGVAFGSASFSVTGLTVNGVALGYSYSMGSALLCIALWRLSSRMPIYRSPPIGGQ